MKSTLLLKIACMALFATFAVVPRFAQGQQSQTTGHPELYTVTDLGTLGGTFAFGGGINQQGWVNGTSNLAGDQLQRAFLWRNGVMIDLKTLGGPSSGSGYAVNDLGVVVGGSEISILSPYGYQYCDFYGFSDNPPHVCLPFAWLNGVMTPLPLLEDQYGHSGINGNAQMANNRGEIVGSSENTLFDSSCSPALVFQQRPVFWEDGAVHELPLLPGDIDGVTTGVNDHGQIVGFAGTGNCANEFLHIMLWENGEPRDLGNLGGMQFNQAQFINNQGQVVGLSNLAGDQTGHAFLWENGQIEDLGTAPGDFSSAAFGINARSQIVGQSCDAAVNCRAVLWQHEQNPPADLNTLIPPPTRRYIYSLHMTSMRTGRLRVLRW